MFRNVQQLGPDTSEAASHDMIMVCLPMPPHVPFYVSDNVKARLGYEPEEIISNTNFWMNMVHEQDIPQLHSGFYHLFTRGYHVYEYRFLKKDGAYKRLLVYLHLHRHRKGTPIRVLGCLREPLPAAGETAGSGKSPLAISGADEYAEMTIDRNDRIRQASPLVETLTGVAPQKMIGKCAHEFIPRDYSFIAGAVFNKIMHRSRDTIHFWTAIQHRRGPLKFIAAECEGRDGARGERFIDVKSKDITCLIAPDGDVHGRSKFRLLSVLSQEKSEECRAADAHSFERLTNREREILYLIVEGHSSPRIAERLAISSRTVEAHRAHLMKKLNVNSLSGLIRYMVCHVASPETN